MPEHRGDHAELVDAADPPQPPADARAGPLAAMAPVELIRRLPGPSPDVAAGVSAASAATGRPAPGPTSTDLRSRRRRRSATGREGRDAPMPGQGDPGHVVGLPEAPIGCMLRDLRPDHRVVVQRLRERRGDRPRHDPVDPDAVLGEVAAIARSAPSPPAFDDE
jgi:hypothetical protein